MWLFLPSRLIFDKDAKTVQEKRENLSADGAGAIGTYGQNKQIGTRLDLGLV